MMVQLQSDEDHNEVLHRNQRDLERLFNRGDMVLVKNYKHGDEASSWFREHLVKKGSRLVRRQELPAEALLTWSFEGSPFRRAAAGKRLVAIISHTWLSKEHPDPEGIRMKELALVDEPYIWLDYVSVYQHVRTPWEQVMFSRALRALHLVFMQPSCVVYRMMTVSENAESSTPYLGRLWTVFEDSISTALAGKVRTIKDCKLIGPGADKTRVPQPPFLFEERAASLIGSSRDATLEKVKEAYREVWPTLANARQLECRGWRDEELKEFLSVLPHMPGVSRVYLRKAPGRELSPKLVKRLADVLQKRGGFLEMRAAVINRELQTESRLACDDPK